MASSKVSTKKAATKAPKSASASKTRTEKATFTSRAVLRAVQPGSWVTCHACEEQIKYQVRMQNMQMICNVYEEGVWNRVEHFHADCYEEADQPYGPAED